MIMMGSDRKKALNQIMGDPDKKDGGEVSGLRSCVSELIECVHERDVEGAENALRACFAELNGKALEGE